MIDALKVWLAGQGLSPEAVSLVFVLVSGAALVLIGVLVNFAVKWTIAGVFHPLIRRTQTTWDDALIERGVLTRLSHLAPALIIHVAGPLVLADYPRAAEAVRTGAYVYMVVAGLFVLSAFMNAALDVYNRFPISHRVPLKIFLQVIKIIVSCLAVVFILASLVGKSPVVFFSGLGAFTAVLILVFKDPILGLVAGIQLISNNMVRRGDWIEMPKYGVDGDVVDVSLTTISVQNWDKTIATVPTYALISDSFKNWRGMSESGGRRIKRAVHIDMNSVRFCDREMLDRFKKIRFIQEYVDRKLDEITAFNTRLGIDDSVLVNGRRLTNLGTFRAYLEAYLRNHEKVRKDMTFLVRHLAPTPEGLPIEIYVFSSDQVWANYEGIQGDIFDHILAVIPLFDLRVFQAPSGADIRALAAAP
jgi:miniconductance mechanosensitive channel